MSVIDDLKYKIRSGNLITRLIVINVAVFLVISIFRILSFLSGENNVLASIENFVQENLALPLSFHGLLHKPWTLITYMFTHFKFMHIFWNMITLFWFGQILSEYTTQKKIIPLYFYGGICGALLTILLFKFVPAFQMYYGEPLIGASAGVTAIIVAAATLVPNVNIGLMFIGQVKLVYVALFVIFIDILSVASYDNIGGNLAHLGGALAGYFFIVQFKKGRDLSKGFNNILDRIGSLFSGKPKMKVVHNRVKKTDEQYNIEKNKLQQQMDQILDKISRSGYESLSKEEKEILFKSSKKL